MSWTLIAAVARNGVIGVNNALPWHLPEDLKHFRELTRGATVLMGRKTWDSLPSAFRPLPGRRNVVISRQAGLTLPGAETVSSLPAAQSLLKDTGPVFVIGGAELYRQTMEFAEALEMTEVACDPEGDAFFPKIDPALWKTVRRETGCTENGLGFAFVRYERSGK